MFSFPLSRGNGVSKRSFGVDGAVGDCSGSSSYSIGVSKRLTGRVGYSGLDSVSLIRAHNLIEYVAKVQIDRLKSNEEYSKQYYNNINEVNKCSKQDHIKLKK